MLPIKRERDMFRKRKREREKEKERQDTRENIIPLEFSEALSHLTADMSRFVLSINSTNLFTLLSRSSHHHLHGSPHSLKKVDAPERKRERERERERERDFLGKERKEDREIIKSGET